MSAWTTLRDDLNPIQWIRKGGDTKDWLRRAGLILAAGTGAGAAGVGPLAGLFGAASGSAASGAGAGGVATGLLGSGTSAVGTGLSSTAPLIPGSQFAATAGTGLGATAPAIPAATGFMNPALSGSGLAAGNSAALQAMNGGSLLGGLKSGMGSLAKVGPAIGMMNAATAPQAPPPMIPRPQPAPQTMSMQMPPELAMLPPTDPRVMQWKMERGLL